MSTTRTSYRIVGIDPGLGITGYGAVDLIPGSEPAIVEAGTFRTDTSAPLLDRLAQLHDDLTALLAELKPDAMAIEQLYSHYAHPQTSVVMGHARGVLLLAAAEANLPVRSLAATRIKKSLTGNGHATKAQMQRAIQSICRLDTLPEPPDVADALAVALCAARPSPAQTIGGQP
jgi:crossover junction endodeoxyribonuclease RuvC